jgi:hypothetical protein
MPNAIASVNVLVDEIEIQLGRALGMQLAIERTANS